MLRQMRLDAGLKQAELAKFLGIAQSDVSRVENGDRQVTALELIDFCEACKVDLADFCSRLKQELDSVDCR